MMQKIVWLIFLSCLSFQLGFTQDINERVLRDSVLSTIQSTRDSANMVLYAQLKELKEKLSIIDLSLQQEQISDKARIENLVERVRAIEGIQQAANQTDLNNYQANYKSAVINLIYMERELKPLLLFRATQDFYETLSTVSNPMSYPGYRQWYEAFKAHIERNRQKDAILGVVHQVLNVTGDLSKGAPIGGPLAQTLFMGMANFVETIDKNQKQLKAQSEKMFTLTMILSQFTHEKDLIEMEWESIGKELGELQKIYSQTLNTNLVMLKIDSTTFKQRFAKENDDYKRLLYLNELTEKISKHIEADRESNLQNWKEKYFYEMQTVQALKIRFGNTTFRISQNLGKYQELIDKYKKSPEIGTQVTILEGKLKKMRDSFDGAFEPLEYIKSADRMYQIR